MIVLGIFSGMSDIAILKSLGLLIADIFIRIFKCISLPIIALSIIVTLSNYRSDGIMKTIWRTTATLATRTLDMHISRVRAKLALRPENGFRIFTVFGYGYRLETAQ
jgi:Na+/H+-dicarboxylate symporter